MTGEPVYEMPPYRPPSEALSVLIRVTRGCPWNRCAFCPMYKGSRFQKRPVGEVKRDIEIAARLYPDARTAFLGDADSIIIPVEQLEEILQHLYRCFAKLERVTSYGRAKTVLRKPIEELRRLSAAGLTRLHVGLESGDDETLKKVTKGFTAAQAIEAGLKVKDAGISLSEYVLIGLGGKERYKEHAESTAGTLNRIEPDFIRIRTLVVIPGTQLASMLDEGNFSPCSTLELLEEERLMIEHLDGIESTFTSDHVSNLLPLDGKLPQDKSDMIHHLNETIESVRRTGWEPARLLSTL
ncbi:MAG: radical SAM protein [Candidatus Hydrogenedentes bacterium]|nr:radical SAM protein [Candidatus Hydrogenedentota bacterium]